MNRGFTGLILGALLLGSSATPALAQRHWDRVYGQDNGMHQGWDNNRTDMHSQYGLNWRKERGWNNSSNDWRNGRRWNPPVYNGVNSAALAQFDARANQLRADIAARLASGAINPVQAARMNSRLDALLSLRAQYGASGGVVSGNELGQLNARLNELRIALRSRIYF